MKEFAKAPAEGSDFFMSLKKIGFLDIGLIVDVLIAKRERTINLQRDAIREAVHACASVARTVSHFSYDWCYRHHAGDLRRHAPTAVVRQTQFRLACSFNRYSTAGKRDGFGRPDTERPRQAGTAFS
jgi:hypothetical protein